MAQSCVFNYTESSLVKMNQFHTVAHSCHSENVFYLVITR